MHDNWQHISEVLDKMLPDINGNYGKELVIDLHDCDVTRFTRPALRVFFIDLCDLIDMRREDLHFWDEQEIPEEERLNDPKTSGISAIQFIITSNCTLHALDLLKRVYINIFSCKDFSSEDAEKFCADFFKGRVVNSVTIERV